jgi:hypothetical protein
MHIMRARVLIAAEAMAATEYSVSPFVACVDVSCV